MAENPDASEHEVIQHPNLEPSEQSSEDQEKGKAEVPKKFSESKFVKWFVKFDQTKLRPFLIHNFNDELVNAMRAVDQVFNYDYGGDEAKEVL